MGGYSPSYPTQQTPQFNYGQPWRPPQYNPNAGQDPTAYGQQIGAAGDPSLSYQPDLTTNDPNRIFRNAQNVDYNVGAGIDANTYQTQQQQGQLYDQYGNLMNSAYGDLANTPGYTSDEANQIIRGDQYNGLATTGDQYNSLAPTSGESAGMTGDTGSYKNYFNPQTITDANTNSASMQRNGVDLSEANINKAVGNQQDAYNQAIDPNKLAASNTYQQGQSDVLNSTAGRLDSAASGVASALGKATSNAGLNPTADYARQAGMSDAEVQQQADAGARDVGLRYQSQMQQAQQQAAASGNASPLAVGALQARLAQQSATSSADAKTNAQLAARQAQRSAATGVQQTQLGAAQYQTGADINAAQYLGSQGSQNAQYEGNLAQNAVQSTENTRLGAQQYLTQAQMQAASGVAGNALQGAENIGSLRTGNEANIGASNVAGQQYIQGTGTGINMAQDQANTQRASQQYGIRQGNQQYQQQNTYNQGMGINNALSQNNQTVANQRLNGQQQYRGWTTQQQGQALGAQQTAQGQQIQNYGTMSGALNNNANAWGNYTLGKNSQGFGTQFKGALAGGIAKALTTPVPSGGG